MVEGAALRETALARLISAMAVGLYRPCLGANETNAGSMFMVTG